MLSSKDVEHRLELYSKMLDNRDLAVKMVALLYEMNAVYGKAGTGSELFKRYKKERVEKNKYVYSTLLSYEMTLYLNYAYLIDGDEALGYAKLFSMENPSGISATVTPEQREKLLNALEIRGFKEVDDKKLAVVERFKPERIKSEESVEEAEPVAEPVAEETAPSVEAPEPVEEPEPLTEAEPEPEQQPESEADRLEKIRDLWGEQLITVVRSIMSAYDRLYESGYGLVSPAGILTNNGIMRSKTDGTLGVTGSPVNDKILYKEVCRAVGEAAFNKYSAGEPDIKKLLQTNTPVTYYEMHIKFLMGHLRYCKGLPAWLREHGIENKSTTKVIKYGDIRGWIQETVENLFYKAYDEMGVVTDAADEAFDESLETVNTVNITLSRSLKNVIVVAEQKKNVHTRLRICSDSPLDVEALKAGILGRLNIGTSNEVSVKQIGEYKDGIADLVVVYNEKSYSQDALFAYQVLDILAEQDIKPTWDNVILGKRDDGTIMTYNFKNAQNPAYGLYAASGSGKGVMTLNLLASALADNCKMLYIDGKPDMSEVLADVAWKDNLDACVFNGVSAKGAEGLENRGNCIRDVKRYYDIQNIPDGIFNTEAEKKKFNMTVTYLRGVQLVCQIAAKRAEQSSSGSVDDWVVGVFDECEQFSQQESNVTADLEAALKERESMKGPDGKKINASQDDACRFIKAYMRWRNVVRSKFKECMTSTFRYACMTVFFVWQTTKFPAQYTKGSILAEIVESAGANMVKIMGRSAAVNYGSTAYGTPSSLSRCKWYDTRFTGPNGGFFAIGKDVNSDDSMEVFRPFNVYSNASNKKLIVQNAKNAGLTEADLVGVSLNSDGSVVKEIGFEGYVNKMLAQYGMTISGQLNQGYTYCDMMVRDIGLGTDLLHFMYNTTNFSCEGAESADDVEINTGGGGGDGGSQQVTDGIPLSALESSVADAEDTRNVYGAGERAPAEEDNSILAQAQQMMQGFGTGGTVETDSFAAEQAAYDEMMGYGGDTGESEPEASGNGERYSDDDWDAWGVGDENGLPDDTDAGGYDSAEDYDSVENYGEEEGSEDGEAGEEASGYGGEAEEPSGGEQEYGDGDDILSSFAEMAAGSDGSRSREPDPEYMDADYREADDDDDGIDRSGGFADFNAEVVRVISQISDTVMSMMTGRGGRTVQMDASESSNVSRLNNDNSIDCTGAYDGPSKWFESMYLKTPAGSQKYAQFMFQSILDRIERAGIKRGNVTRLSLYGGNVYVNGKIVNLNGVLGGVEDIRLMDIVSFMELAKRFKMLREIRVDSDILNSAALEFGCDMLNAALRFFNLWSRLSAVYMITVDMESGRRKAKENLMFNREAAMAAINGQTEEDAQMAQMRRMSRQQSARNEFDMYCNDINSTGISGSGSQKIWGNKLARWSTSRSAQSFKNKKAGGMIGGVVYGIIGIGLGTVLGMAYGGFNGIRGAVRG